MKLARGASVKMANAAEFNVAGTYVTAAQVAIVGAAIVDCLTGY